MDRPLSEIHKDWHRFCIQEARRCRGTARGAGAAHAQLMREAARARFYFANTRGL